jgi:hypothetical protein
VEIEMKRLMMTGFSVAMLLTLTGCMEPAAVYDPGTGNWDGNGYAKGDSSAHAVFLDFEFDGALFTSSCFNPRSAIDQQLLYTVGQLNGHKSVGRLDQLVISNVQKETVEDGCQVTYSAKIPVAWGKPHEVPMAFTFQFPRDVSRAGTDRFMENYEHGCLDWGAHDVTPGIFWYYYRPDKASCQLDEADISPSEARVTPSSIQTTGKYPEYHKVWEDNVFEVVAIFGKVDDGGGNSDGGVVGYNTFVRELKTVLRDYHVSTTPMSVSSSPGTDIPEITFEADLGNDRMIRVSAFLIDSVGSADMTFWNQYEALTPTADFIVYNGHSGLGANIRKLARKGVWETGQYSIVFMNGCDTYAYVDSALADAHAEVNEDDPDGTKYLDVVANAMPSFFRSMPHATMAILSALMDPDNPKTYEEMFENVDSSEIVLVTGEHDNVYEPGYTEPDPF